MLFNRNLRPERLGLRPERLDLRPERLEKPQGGDVRIVRQT